MNVDPMYAENLINIQTRFKSKKELSRFMTSHLFLYLPSDSHTTLYFLQQVITGRKRVKKQTEIVVLKVPLWPELSVGNNFRQAMNIPGFQEYIPDEWRNSKRVDRKFFWAVLATLHPTYVQHLIRGAQSARQAYHAQQQVQRRTITLQPDWINRLLEDAGFQPAPGRRVGPSLLNSRELRPQRPPRQVVVFHHGVDVNQYIAAYNENFGIPQNNAQQQQNAPQQQANNQPEQIQQQPGPQQPANLAQEMGGDLVNNVLVEEEENENTFNTAQVNFVRGSFAEENAPLLAGANRQVEFQSAQDGE